MFGAIVRNFFTQISYALVLFHDYLATLVFDSS